MTGNALSCPPWCRCRDNHLGVWDCRETGTGMFIRTHEATPLPEPSAPVWAYVFAEERVGFDGRCMGPPMIAAGVEEFRDGEMLPTGLTVQETRAFARLLLEAADQAEAAGRAS